MKVKVRYDKSVRTLELKSYAKISTMLKKLKINLEEIVCKRNGKIVTEFDTLKDNDNIEIINITTGG